MNKNNVFEVLANNEPEEVEEIPKRKLSKKDQRKKEKILRKAYGDHVQKDDQGRENDMKHHKEGGDKNERSDRHSGTKNQAFGIKSKNGGYEEDLKQFEGNVHLENEEVEEEEEVNENQGEIKQKKSSRHGKKKHHHKKIKYDEKNFPALS